MLRAPCLRSCERGNVPAADTAACTTAAVAVVAGVAVAGPPTSAVIFGVAAVAAAAGVAAAAHLEVVDGAGGLPSATPPVPAPASATGALRVAGRTGPTTVMSRSDSLSKSAILPPP